ncbi:hypothetical protein PHET_03996 [Paragonimus heterotremus]|uniref:Cilia- and flagella-associated protein 70 n=1 Tax=Paragonimus heterotremus TaxID=100268 RepID=A0A8J4SQC4_9TREM|nr:hypothetical protein PHET_03996 [Paragonimus heterotremus]
MVAGMERETAVKKQDGVNIEIKSIEGYCATADDIKFSVKLEFKGSSLGESTKVEVNKAGNLNFNHTFKFVCNFDKDDIDCLCNQPFIISLFEHKPKDKKQKEGKVEVVGQGVFDCLRLLRGESRIDKSIVLHKPSCTRSLEPLVMLSYLESFEYYQPHAQISIYSENPTVTSNEYESSLLVKVYIGSMQNIPDGIQARDSSKFICTMPMCSQLDFSEPERPMVFTNGSIKLPSDEDYNEKFRRWPESGQLKGFVEYIPESAHFASVCEESLNLDEEVGDYCSSEHLMRRNTGMNENPKVVWNQERKLLLTSDGSRNLRGKISSQKIRPVEFAKVKFPNTDKGKADEEISYTYHGVAFVNFAPLLYPGVTKIKGAYRIVPYCDTEYTEKTHRQKSIMDEVLRAEQKNLPGSQKKSQQKPDRKMTSRPGVDDVEHIETESDKNAKQESVVLTESATLSEGQQYLDAQSYVVLEIEVDRPLVPKRSLEVVDQNISSYVEAKKPVPTHHATAAKAVSEYHRQIGEVARYILMEFKTSFSDLIHIDQLPVDSESVEQLKHELFYSLNSSGKYFAFKERLKFAVIKIVREKFFQTSPFTEEAHLQVFLRDLFVYLVDEMHVGLWTLFKPREYTPPVDRQQFDCDTLLRFATEAESLGDVQAAIKHYQERVVRDPSSISYWIDFGTFYLGQKELEEAGVCFTRILRINNRHPTALLLCGLVAAMQGRNEEAADFLEATVTHDRLNAIAWTILGVFYETVSNDIGSEMAFTEALRADDADEVLSEQASRKPEKKYVETTSNLQAIANDDLAQSSDQISVADTGTGSIDLLDPKTTVGENIQKSDSLHSHTSSQNQKKQSPARAPKALKSPAAMKQASMSHTEVQPQPKRPTRRSLFLRATEFLLDHHIYSFASATLAHELVQQRQLMAPFLQTKTQPATNFMQVQDIQQEVYSYPLPWTQTPPIPGWLKSRLLEYHMACAYLYSSQAGPECSSIVQAELLQVTQMDVEMADAWSRLGHWSYEAGDMQTARQHYERCLLLTTWPPKDSHLLCLRLGAIYLQEKEVSLTDGACKRQN